MMRNPVCTCGAICLLALLSDTPASARSGGVLPLEHGIYVAEGTPCTDPPFAMMQDYDGKGIGDPHSSDCRARILSHSGDTYVLDNTCRDAGTGPAPRSSQRLKIRVEAPGRYSVIVRGEAGAYRRCGPDLRAPRE